MTTHPECRLDVLCRQLTESIMNAAWCAREIATILGERCAGRFLGVNEPEYRRSDNALLERPVLDEATLTVVWKGKMLHLGHTQGFWLLTRLMRSPNQYVTHLDLLQEIWDDEFTDTGALRAGVRRLRLKLRRGGMGDLADAIVGHHGRYMLTLTYSTRHAKVTASPQ